MLQPYCSYYAFLQQHVFSLQIKYFWASKPLNKTIRYLTPRYLYKMEEIYQVWCTNWRNKVLQHLIRWNSLWLCYYWNQITDCFGEVGGATIQHQIVKLVYKATSLYILFSVSVTSIWDVASIWYFTLLHVAYKTLKMRYFCVDIDSSVSIISVIQQNTLVWKCSTLYINVTPLCLSLLLNIFLFPHFLNTCYNCVFWLGNC